MKPPPHILLLVEGGSEERFIRAFLPHLDDFGGNLSPSFRCFVRTMREELTKLREGPSGE